MSNEECSDAELVSRCLSGDREAFGSVVDRYRSLICSLAYSATGSLNQSEDLAQETFVTAWRQLPTLREPAKLRSWLCGIARLTTANTLRRQGRDPVHGAGSLDDLTHFASPSPPPAEQAISREEQDLLWRALEKIPENYREPMILFYREQQLVDQVARLLELSEETTRQRLSRGRKLLESRVTAFVANALKRTQPGKSFTLGVLAALPMMSVSATAATMGTAATQGSALAKAGASLGWLGAILGPITGILGGWIGVKASLDNAQSDRERRYLIRMTKITVALAIFFAVALALPIFLSIQFQPLHPVLLAGGIAGVSLAYLAALIFLILRTNRTLRQIRQQEAAQTGNEPGSTKRTSFFKPYEFRSRHSFLNLPLVHIRMGNTNDEKPRPAVGWIAIGDIALGGLFAFGGWAIAPVSVGGMAIGLFSLGGFALGLLSFAGLALGYWAAGGVAVGSFALGGCAIAWQAANGGLAVAFELASGGVAYARHANDAVAQAFMQNHGFFRHAVAAMKNGWLLSLVWVPMLLVIWQAHRMRSANHA